MRTRRTGRSGTTAAQAMGHSKNAKERPGKMLGYKKENGMSKDYLQLFERLLEEEKLKKKSKEIAIIKEHRRRYATHTQNWRNETKAAF